MKTTIWFRKKGWFYLPVNVAGLVITLIAISFCVNVFLAIDRNSHSISDTLYGIFPYFISIFAVLFWVATNTSEKN